MPIITKDLKGVPVTHMDFDDFYINTYRDEKHGITSSIRAERKSNRNPEPKIERSFTLDNDGDNVYDTAQEVVDAYNKKHGS